MLDYTLQQYSALCRAIIQSNYKIINIRDYCINYKYSDNIFLILRHDVDKRPEQALKMAQIEKELGISSTYYFRKTRKVFNPDIIRKISDLGHEIGYHYEVLDKAEGDYSKAIEIFKSELEEFRNICHIDTVCMHGNPMSKWLNRNIWTQYDIRDFKLLGEAYLSLNFSKIWYISDTGRCWNSDTRVKDYENSLNHSALTNIRKTTALIKILESKKFKNVCLNVHPQRWSDEIGPWIYESIGQNIKNLGKRFLKAVK